MENNITKRLSLILVLLMLLPLSYFSHEAKADTLGPLVDRSEELNVTAVIEIHSPQNTTYSAGEILMNFTLIYEGQDYDVGYSLDGGIIERISVSKISVEPAPLLPMPPYIRVTCRGIMVLRDLSDGVHTITVYGGYYYGGINQRYEVFKRANISFSVDNSQPQTTSTPEPTSTTPPPTPPRGEGIQAKQLMDFIIGGIASAVAIAVLVLLYYLTKKE